MSLHSLIIKLNAAGDVVRTTPLLRRLGGSVTWLTANANKVLVDGLCANLRCVTWEDRAQVLDSRYDLLINLEDDVEVGAFARSVRHAQLFGAYMDGQEQIRYTDDAARWFDLGLVSVHGREQADRLKLLNRRTYQELIFEGLGFRFEGDRYHLPRTAQLVALSGDVAIAPLAGAVWPMKGWAHYDLLKRELEAAGLTVNVLPLRPSLLQHIDDVNGHRCLVSGDSLPMHLALGGDTRCVTLFNCTSPWEIHDYGLQTKIVSPLLAEFFYKRGIDIRATTAIGLDEVLRQVMATLSRSEGAHSVPLQ
jgi:heptosyltransferase-2